MCHFSALKLPGNPGYIVEVDEHSYGLAEDSGRRIHEMLSADEELAKGIANWGSVNRPSKRFTQLLVRAQALRIGTIRAPTEVARTATLRAGPARTDLSLFLPAIPGAAPIGCLQAD